MTPFVSEVHLPGVIDVLLRVRNSDPEAPSSVDTGPTAEDLKSWFLQGDLTNRWVMLQDGLVAGHIMLVEPHSYLTDFYHQVRPEGQDLGQMLEISKFFIDPPHRNTGLGEKMLKDACHHAVSKGLKPALAVLESSLAARRLYGRIGMTELGTFKGIQGVNYVFVQD